MGIDDLPLLDSEDPTKRSGTENVSSENWPQVSHLVQAPGFSLGTSFALGSSHFPVQSEGGAHSVRRESWIDNVKTRETKRPKEREKDKEYRRLTLTSANVPFCQFHDRTVSRSHPAERSQGLVQDVFRTSPAQSVPSPAGQQGATSASTPPGDRNAGGSFFTAGRRPYVDPSFEITLIYEGRQVRHEVSESLPVSSLMNDAGRIYRIDPNALILMLFSASPTILNRMLTLRGPPWVVPNSSLFVFVAANTSEGRLTYPAMGGERFQLDVAAVPKMHSKLLGTFKLPKFDGTPKSWKQGDLDFVRFLGLHQLEHVLLEGFPQILPHSEAVASNKIVYFLIEEAVLPGTLASKYVRQAPLWDGHGWLISYFITVSSSLGLRRRRF